MCFRVYFIRFIFNFNLHLCILGDKEYRKIHEFLVSVSYFVFFALLGTTDERSRIFHAFRIDRIWLDSWYDW